MQLSEALKVLTTTYKGLDAVASGLPVDAKEVNDALLKAKPDSVEFVALSALAKCNPYNQNKEKEIKNVNTNKDE